MEFAKTSPQPSPTRAPAGASGVGPDARSQTSSKAVSGAEGRSRPGGVVAEEAGETAPGGEAFADVLAASPGAPKVQQVTGRGSSDLVATQTGDAASNALQKTKIAASGEDVRAAAAGAGGALVAAQSANEATQGAATVGATLAGRGTPGVNASPSGNAPGAQPDGGAAADERVAGRAVTPGAVDVSPTTQVARSGYAAAGQNARNAQNAHNMMKAGQSAPPAEMQQSATVSSDAKAAPPPDAMAAAPAAASSAAGAASAAGPSRGAALPQHLTLKVAENIAHVSRGEMEQVRFDLRPPDLGQVSIRMQIRGGAARIVVAVEQTAAYDAMRASAGSLQQALQESGLDVDGEGLRFELAGEDRRDLQGRGQGDDADGRPAGDHAAADRREGRGTDEGASGAAREIVIVRADPADGLFL